MQLDKANNNNKTNDNQNSFALIYNLLLLEALIMFVIIACLFF